MNMMLIKKEIKENLLAMKGIIWLFIVTILFSTMSYSFVSVKELSLMAQTDVMVTMGKIILSLGLIISIILSSVTFSNEREQSTLESLLLTPISKLQLMWGKLIGVMFMWILIFIISVPYIVTLSNGTGLTMPMILFIFVIGTLTVFSFSCISIGLSIILGTSKNAIITSLIIFLIVGIPAFLSTSIIKAGFGAVLDKASPLSNTINMLKAIIVTRDGILGIGKFLIPILIFSALSYAFLLLTVKKINFKGGE